MRSSPKSRMMSPTLTPAVAAGPPSLTDSTKTPTGCASFALEASSLVTSRAVTPIHEPGPKAATNGVSDVWAADEPGATVNQTTTSATPAQRPASNCFMSPDLLPRSQTAAAEGKLA